MLFFALFACVPEADTAQGDPAGPDTGDTAAVVDSGDTATPPPAKWQFLVFINGDNDLEAWVPHDLNELEITGSGDGVEVLVQADRIDGYSEKDGDWTGVRRYRMERDDDLKSVTSPVLEELGELDMGSPEVLADFLAWAAEHYPAEHRVLVMWNHGDGWTIRSGGSDPDAAAPPPGISYDDTDGGFLSFAEGTFAEAVRADVEAHDRFDVIGFDACNMASWEIAHALQPYARAMSAAETTVGYEGFQYGPILAWLRANPEATPAALAEEMSRGAVEEGGEQTHSAVDLDAAAAVSTALDALAGAALADEDLALALRTYRRETRGADPVWKNWYLDVGDLARVIEAAGDPTLAPLGADLAQAMAAGVVHAYGDEEYDWTTGLTVWFDPDGEYVDLYTDGPGATWSRDTRWGELMRAYAEK